MRSSYLVQNSARKLKGVRGRGLKPISQWAAKRFLFNFRHLLLRFKNRNICHALHWICITGKIFIKI